MESEIFRKERMIDLCTSLRGPTTRKLLILHPPSTLMPNTPEDAYLSRPRGVANARGPYAYFPLFRLLLPRGTKKTTNAQTPRKKKFLIFFVLIFRNLKNNVGQKKTGKLKLWCNDKQAFFATRTRQCAVEFRTGQIVAYFRPKKTNGL